MRKAICGVLLSGLAIPTALSGCGLSVPAKSISRSDTPPSDQAHFTAQSKYEDDIVSHVVCELGLGLTRAQRFELPWLSKWGTAVTLTITAQDQGGLSPGATFVNPLQNAVKLFAKNGNVTIARSFSAGVGVSAATTATRTETIQFTYLNSDLLQSAKDIKNCKRFQGGTQIDGDLKIGEFIFDKAMLARAGNTSLYGETSKNFNATSFKRPGQSWEWPTFNTFTEEVTFLAAFGGNATPSWKLVSGTIDANSSLIAAQRTYTNDLILTMGPVTPPTEKTAATLSTAAQSQHNARVQASAIATSIHGGQ
ncbi:hypothetical protein [Mesorhizobium sp. CO1-1-4]|uniref:hypothetical protein n=1 Tax=Mesorhizobium sp. CO1-1-4 TaxID=2876633 RepID=UPI001CCF833F|nr:hypothetical protein [Mesorhizobium sp. CO1-1-4]MBZ9740686.1 hypothetical protein [Mesorhizobium sp. CO1-1-4]